MPEKYTREQLRKLYQKLPEELKEAMWSDEGTQAIWNVCERNKVDRAVIPKITELSGYVLLGILPPDEFQKTLEKEVGLKKAIAKKIAQEIHRHIFFPVRRLLTELYKVEIGAGPDAPEGKPLPTKPGATPETPSAETPDEATPTKEKPKGPDAYRESIK